MKTVVCTLYQCCNCSLTVVLDSTVSVWDWHCGRLLACLSAMNCSVQLRLFSQSATSRCLCIMHCLSSHICLELVSAQNRTSQGLYFVFYDHLLSVKKQLLVWSWECTYDSWLCNWFTVAKLLHTVLLLLLLLLSTFIEHTFAGYVYVTSRSNAVRELT